MQRDSVPCVHFFILFYKKKRGSVAYNDARTMQQPQLKSNSQDQRTTLFSVRLISFLKGNLSSTHFILLLHFGIVCATLGELSEDNANSWFRKNEQGTTSDPTANCILQVVPNKADKKLWDEMDEATFQAIEVMAGDGNFVEWWHQPQPKDSGDLPPGVWRYEKPGHDTIRMPGIVHEASLIPLGNRNECPVDEDYKVKGVSNVVCFGYSN